MTGHLVVLVGPPGAGKSTVGRLLADRLGQPFLDTDDEITRTTGKSVADIFVDEGEDQFRRLEREAVVAALRTHRGILALGGGSILDADVRDRLAGGTVVFLDVGIADAAKRAGFNRGRPLLLGNPRAQWLRLMEYRRPLYEQVASTVVSTDGCTPLQVTDRVAQELTRGSVRGTA